MYNSSTATINDHQREVRNTTKLKFKICLYACYIFWKGQSKKSLNLTHYYQTLHLIVLKIVAFLVFQFKNYSKQVL